MKKKLAAWWEKHGPVVSAAFNRAGQTAAQVVIAAIGTDALTTVVELDWGATLSLAGTSALLSLLKSYTIGMPEVPTSKTITARLHSLAKPLPDADVDGCVDCGPPAPNEAEPYSEDV